MGQTISDYFVSFWNSITSSTASTTSNAVTYGVDFFQNIGNAVAGAIGNIFLVPFHFLIDFGLALGWVFENLIKFFGYILMPFEFLITFFGVFVQSIVAGNSVPATPLFVQNSQALALVQSFPLMSTLGLVLAGLVVVAGVLTTIKVINL
jgi:hypothetical protein